MPKSKLRDLAKLKYPRVSSEYEKADRVDPGRVKARSVRSLSEMTETHGERAIQKIVDEDVTKMKKAADIKPALTPREAEFAQPKDPQGVSKRTSQLKVQSKSKVEAEKATIKPKAPKTSAKPAPKIPVKLQQRVAAEAQQERHAARMPQKPPAESPGFDIKKPKATKQPTLRQRVGKAIVARKEAKAAKAAATSAPPAKGIIGKALRVSRAVGKVARPVGVAADVATTAVAVHEGARAVRAGAALERQAKHAEQKYGLKVKVKKPNIFKAMIAHPISGEGPRVDVDIEYPKPKPLSERAKKRLKSLGQM